MIKRIIGWVFKSALLVVVFIHLLLLLFSVSGISTTILIYASLLYICLGIIKRVEAKRGNSLQNYKIALVSLSVSLFCLELGLKYMVKQHLAYTERNGGYFYFSPYLDNKVKNMVGVISPNPERWYKKRYTPHSDKYETKSEYIYLHRINSLGLRGPEPVAGKNVFRIMSLGDSFTEGAGAPEDSTWIHLLAEQFETRSLDAFTYLNGGVNGADPFLSYYIFKELMTRFSPQLVILLINSSDISDHMNKGGKERFDENARITYPKGPWWEPLYACSYIFRGIVHIVADMDYNFRSPAEQKEREAIARTAIKDFIVKDYKAIMTANNISFWVFCIPRQYELEMKTRVYPDFEQYLSEAGVQYEDLADDIEEYLKKKQISTDDIYWQNDMHFNAKGYQLISELMFKKISSDTAIFHPDNIVH